MSDANRGRIAIKFGAGSSRPTPPSSLGKRPRSHHALGGGASDSDGSDSEGARGRHEKITGFGTQGAETEGGRPVKADKEYIIERQANRSWKDELKARRNRDGEAQSVETDPADREKDLKWGLTIKERTTEPEEAQTSPETAEAIPNGDDPSRTVDDEALDALLGKLPEKKLSIAPHLTEDDAYRRDVEAAGAPSTLQDYEAMPVEEFGAALLRGMGWSGEKRGPKIREVRRRPNRLGLGAKELKEEEDLGGWNQNGKKKSRPRLDDYRREESKRRESRRHEESYKSERDRERRREREDHRDRHRERDRERGRDHYDRDRRR